MTLEEALALPDRDDCRYELDEGALIETPLPLPRHQMVVMNLLYPLATWAKSSGKGVLFPSDTPFLLQRSPDTLRGPDIALVSNERVETTDMDWVFEGAPNLAVEVASPSDRISALLKKTSQYLEAGAEEVWLIMPASREIHVYRPDESPRILRTGEILESRLLPGFALPVAEIFE